MDFYDQLADKDDLWSLTRRTDVRHRVSALCGRGCYLDKLVDELAKGKKMEKILRTPG